MRIDRVLLPVIVLLSAVSLFACSSGSGGDPPPPNDTVTCNGQFSYDANNLPVQTLLNTAEQDLDTGDLMISSAGGPQPSVVQGLTIDLPEVDGPGSYVPSSVSYEVSNGEMITEGPFIPLNLMDFTVTLTAASGTDGFIGSFAGGVMMRPGTPFGADVTNGNFSLTVCSGN